MDDHEDEALEGELIGSTGSVLAQVSKAEFDQQIATAKRYPRSVKQFISAATGLVTLNADVATDCMYALKRGRGRDAKTIEGPSVRFAEVVLSCWKNARASARVVDEGERFVTAQGIFFDVENNVGISMEVGRRITTKDGTRFGDDMIGVTGNAACSIAVRNAILRGIPKAFWKPIYDAARACAVGDASTLADNRLKMLAYFQKMGVTGEQVFMLLEVQGIEDVNLDHLALMKGIATSIKDGETTVDKAFEIESRKVGDSNLNEKVGSKEPKGEAPKKEPKKEPEQPKQEKAAEPKKEEPEPPREDDAEPNPAPPVERSEGALQKFSELVTGPSPPKTSREWEKVQERFIGPKRKFKCTADEEAKIRRMVKEGLDMVPSKGTQGLLV